MIAEPPSNSPVAPPTRSHIVLLVDDEPVGLQVRRLLLERGGYKVFSALDGPAGLRIFAQEPIEAVVLDFSMPGMNGGEVALRMRETKPQIPILMLSAYTSLPPEVSSRIDVAMTKGEGASALLKKLGTMLRGESVPDASH